VVWNERFGKLDLTKDLKGCIWILKAECKQLETSRELTFASASLSSSDGISYLFDMRIKVLSRERSLKYFPTSAYPCVQTSSDVEVFRGFNLLCLIG
jgi:hypothetical protein